MGMGIWQSGGGKPQDAEQRLSLQHLGSDFRINGQADHIRRMDTWSLLGTLSQMPHTCVAEQAAIKQKNMHMVLLGKVSLQCLAGISLQDWLQGKGVKNCSSQP